MAMCNMCKKMNGHCIKRVGFLLQSKNRFIFRHLFLKKSFKILITEYITDVRLLYNKRKPLFMTVVDGSTFLKIFKTIT